MEIKLPEPSSFEDQPLVNLLGKNPADMNQTELQAYINELRDMRTSNSVNGKKDRVKKETNEVQSKAKAQDLLSGLDL